MDLSKYESKYRVGIHGIYCYFIDWIGNQYSNFIPFGEQTQNEFLSQQGVCYSCGNTLELFRQFVDHFRSGLIT